MNALVGGKDEPARVQKIPRVTGAAVAQTLNKYRKGYGKNTMIWLYGDGAGLQYMGIIKYADPPQSGLDEDDNIISFVLPTNRIARVSAEDQGSEGTTINRTNLSGFIFGLDPDNGLDHSRYLAYASVEKVRIALDQRYERTGNRQDAMVKAERQGHHDVLIDFSGLPALSIAVDGMYETMGKVAGFDVAPPYVRAHPVEEGQGFRLYK